MLGIILVGILVFIPAGTFFYWNGLLFMGILFIPMFFAGIIMLRKNPALLRSRLDAKEKLGSQSLIIKLSGLMFIAAFVLAGLSFRFGWLLLPRWLSYAAAVTFLLSYIIYAEVLRENSYLSRTIEVQDGQKVIDSGLYGIVRHPMYSATLLLFISMPLILGSLISFIIMLAYPAIIVKRLLGEEEFLTAELEGYSEYKNKVKYRLIPFIW